MPIDSKLIFTGPPSGGRLVFGEADEITIPEAAISADADFGPDDLATDGRLLWDSGVSRGERYTAPITWQDADRVGARARQAWQDAQRVIAQACSRWQDGAAISARAAQKWAEADRLRVAASTRWQDGAAMRHTNRTEWQEAVRLRAIASTRWQDGADMRHATRNDWQEAIRLRHLVAQRWQDGAAMRREMRHSNGPGVPVRVLAATRWQDAMRPPAGLSQPLVPVVPPLEPCYDPATLGRLAFSDPLVAGDGRLVFICIRGGEPEFPPGLLYILPARYYMAVHSLTAQLLPSMQPFPIYGVSLKGDAGSFARSFTARGPMSLFDLLAPTAGVPQSVQITLDGMAFVFVVTGITEAESHGQRGAQITGKSITSLISAPYARETARLSTQARTAQQLALEALEFSGVDLSWGLDDWLVPAGAWSHLGTPLAAVQAIVEAAGGYLQSHRTLPTLVAAHPYPTLPGGLTGGPWNWGGSFAADVELAADAVITRSVQRSDGADVDAVYLAGSGGFGAFVSREGTAGAKLSPLVTDPLISAVEAGRQRGLSILGAAGAKHLVQIDTGLLTGPSLPGLIDVGQLLQVNASPPWRGRVRSASVSAEHGREVVQSLTVERHLEGA